MCVENRAGALGKAVKSKVASYGYGMAASFLRNKTMQVAGII